jgi:dihydrofolate reductase
VQAKKDIWRFGRGELLRSLLAIGAVDSVEAAVITVLLGDGLPLLENQSSPYTSR